MGNTRLGLLLLVVLGGCAPVYPANSETPCSIPLKLHNGNPYVQAMVNGRGPFTFLVDTGTSTEAIVSPALVKWLNLPLAGRNWLVDISGKGRQSVDEVSIESLGLGDRRFHSVRATVHESLATMGRYDGVLGFALFRDSILTLDFPKRCLRLDDEGLTSGSDVLPFTTPRNIPVVALTMKGRSIPAMIDSGGGAISLPANSVPEVEFLRTTEVQVRVRTQVDTFFIRGGVIDGDVVLGSHVFKEPFVEISDRILMANLGAASLQDFVITFDQHHGLVRFQARKNKHQLLRSQIDDWTAGPQRAGVGQASWSWSQ